MYLFDCRYTAAVLAHDERLAGSYFLPIEYTRKVYDVILI